MATVYKFAFDINDYNIWLLSLSELFFIFFTITFRSYSGNTIFMYKYIYIHKYLNVELVSAFIYYIFRNKLILLLFFIITIIAHVRYVLSNNKFLISTLVNTFFENICI